MKKYLLYSYLLILLTGCYSLKKEKCYSIKPDNSYAFLGFIKREYNFNYLKLITDTREYGTNNKFYDYSWIRNKENLKTYYASIKSIGLKKFISDEQFKKPLFTSHFNNSFWENRSLKEIIEGLLKNYETRDSSATYYNKFWNRRKNENNEKIVFNILKDVHSIYLNKKNDYEINWKSNNKISTLLSFDYELNNSNEVDLELYQNYYTYLDSIKLYASAHNLIKFILKDKKLDEKTIDQLKKIETQTIQINKKVDCNEYSNQRYNAKWFIPLYDEGP